MPRVQFTVRQMMVVVAITIVVLIVASEIRSRQQRFSRLAAHHRSKVAIGFYAQPVSFDPKDPLPLSRARWDWYEELARKYERAARHPWLPVAPDPPEPK